MAWAAEFDAILDINDPTNSRFNSSEEIRIFKATGRELVDKLRLELGHQYEVVQNIRAGVKVKAHLGLIARFSDQG